MQEEYCTLDPITRKLTLTEPQRIAGVESDENARGLKFKFPKTVDDIDLTQMQLRINFMNSRQEKGQHIVTDMKPMEGEEGYITFTWPFSRLVTHHRGYTKFVICAVKTDESGTITAEWNTALAQMRVLEGLEVDEPEISPEEKDIIAQLISICQNSADEAVTAAQQAQEEAEKVLDIIPAGGTKGQVLTKLSDENKDYNWQDPTGDEPGEPGTSGNSQIVDLGEISTEGTVIPADKGAVMLGDGNPVAMVYYQETVNLLFQKNYVYEGQLGIYSATLLGNGVGVTLRVMLGENGVYTASVTESNFPYYVPEESVTQDSMLIRRQGKAEWELTPVSDIINSVVAALPVAEVNEF